MDLSTLLQQWKVDQHKKQIRGMIQHLLGSGKRKQREEKKKKTHQRNHARQFPKTGRMSLQV